MNYPMDYYYFPMMMGQYRDYNDIPEDEFPIDGAMPVEYWYGEIEQYEWFGNEPMNIDTNLKEMDPDSWRSFTQLVWRDSSEIGIGCTRNGNGDLLVVADYDPPGNVPGSFKSSVLSLA